mgnify:CR=1 FL=1
MEITKEIMNRMVSIKNMSALDPECYFLVCKEEKISTVRFEDKKSIDKEIESDKGRYSNHVGYYKNGKYFSINK